MATTVETTTVNPEDLGPSDFAGILAEQKKEKKKEKDAIANSAVQFLANKRIELGYTANKLKEQRIGSTAQSIVRDFSSDLDTLRDVENYDQFKDFVKDQTAIVKEFQKTLKETKGEGGKGRYGQLNADELDYVVKHMQPVVEELQKVVSVTQRFKFKVDEIKSAFKPTKIIDRLFGSDEGFIGKRIRAYIQRKERAEEKVGQAQRGAVGEKFRSKLDKLEEKASGEPMQDVEGVGQEALPKRDPLDDDLNRILLGQKPKGPGKSVIPSGVNQSVAKETQSEAAELSENRYEESKNIFEVIADNTGKTVDYLKDLVDVEKKQKKEDEGSGSSMFDFLGNKGKGGFFKNMIGKGKNVLGRGANIGKNILSKGGNVLRSGLNIGRTLATGTGMGTALTGTALFGAVAAPVAALAYANRPQNEEESKYMQEYGPLDETMSDEDYKTYNEGRMEARKEGEKKKFKFGDTPDTMQMKEEFAKMNPKTSNINQIMAKRLGMTPEKLGVTEDEFLKKVGVSKGSYSADKLLQEVRNKPETEENSKPIFNTPIINNNNSTNQSVQNMMDVSATNKDQTFRRSIASLDL